MLIPGIIPDKEPVLRVGIILPEDRKTTIFLDIHEPGSCHIELDNKKSNLPGTGKLKLELRENIISLSVPEPTSGLSADKEQENKHCHKVKLRQEKPDSYVMVNDVPAGRGFHWLKEIAVKLPGSIEIDIKKGFLCLTNELPLETYLACVATSEMSAESPASFIEAQTIAARSWMLANVERKHVELGFDVCNDDCCQRYQGVNNITRTSIEGAARTRGQVLMWKDTICDARYSKSCGGIMEKFENLWDGDPLPYMQNIADGPGEFNIDLTREDDMREWVSQVPETYCSPHYIPENQLKKYMGKVDEESNYFRWEKKVSQEELCVNLNNKLDIDADKVVSLTPLKRGGSGRLLELEIKYLSKEGKTISMIIEKDYEVRRLLHKDFLFSSAIIIEELYADQTNIHVSEIKVPAAFIYKGAGWGHGAGMCQIGGIGMSLKGHSAEEIVSHYYPGAELKKIY